MSSSSVLCVFTISIGAGQPRGKLSTIRGLQHYYITDARDLSLPKGWIPIYIDSLPSLNGIDSGRRTSKLHKFGPLPVEICENHQYALYVDRSLIHHLTQINSDAVLQCVGQYPQAHLIAALHPNRAFIPEEIQVIKGIDNYYTRGGTMQALQKWESFIRRDFNTIPLPACGVFVRKTCNTDKSFERALTSIPRLMDVWGLGRDQIMWGVVMERAWKNGQVAIGDGQFHKHVVNRLIPGWPKRCHAAIVASPYQKQQQRLVITGAGGFLGSRLVQACRGYGYWVREYDILTTGGDILNLKQVQREFVGAEIIIHLAACSDLNVYRSHPEKSAEINRQGTKNVIAAAGGRRILFASTCCCYGNNGVHPSDEKSALAPTEPYAQSKADLEQAIIAASEENCCMRLATFYGETMRPALAPAVFISQCVAQKPIKIHGKGTQTRTLTHVDDIVSGIITILRSQTHDNIINVTTEHSVDVLTIARVAMEVTGQKVPLQHVPDRPGQIYEETISNARLLALGWKPQVTFKAGMIRSYNYYMKNNQQWGPPQVATIPNLTRKLIRLESQYNGFVHGVKRSVRSPHEPKNYHMIHQGGDRMSNLPGHNNYGRYYATYLHPFLKSHKKLHIAEVGILQGSGLAILCELFPNAEVHGFDIDISIFERNIKKLKANGAFRLNTPMIHAFDQFQNNALMLQKLGPFDIVIDDGCHLTQAIIQTIQSFTPNLAPKFVYFIEDNASVYRDIKTKFRRWTVNTHGILTVLLPGQI